MNPPKDADSNARTTAESRLKVAWFSPSLRQSSAAGANTSAWTSELLLPLLRRTFQIDHFCEVPSAEHTLDYRCALERHAAEPYDVFFYQVEDSALNDFVRRHLLLMPGIVWFHDILMRPRSDPIMRTELCGKSRAQRDAVPLNDSALKAEIQNAAFALFSSERNIGEFRRLHGGSSPGPKTFFVPYPAACWEGAPRGPDDRLSIGLCCPPLLEYRSHKILSAAASLGQPVSLYWLVEESEHEAAARLAAEAGADVHFIAPRNFAAWQELCPTLHAACHLLCSVYGDPGPWLTISMAAGCLCLVSDFSAAALLPEQTVKKIRCGFWEQEQIRTALLACAGRLPSQPQMHMDRGVCRSCLAELYSPEVVAGELGILLRQSAARAQAAERAG